MTSAEQAELIEMIYVMLRTAPEGELKRLHNIKSPEGDDAALGLAERIAGMIAERFAISERHPGTAPDGQ